MRVSKEYNQKITIPAETQGRGQWHALENVADFFNAYKPPFTMCADALFCVAWCPVAPLKETFPTLPFFSLLGKTPLVLWFARFNDFDYTDAADTTQTMSNTPGALPYHELGIGTLLWRRGFFVPSLYASSDFGVQLGLAYDMPKQPTLPIEVQISREMLRVNLKQGKLHSFIWAHKLGTGRLLAQIVGSFLPLTTWPIAFPSDSSIQAGISGVDRIQIAHIQAGRLTLEAPWLPRMASFFPYGLYFSNLRLELP